MNSTMQTLGKYRIIRQLGRGGFGTVYLAKDTSLDDRPVALKVLHPQLLVDPDTITLFGREAGVGAKLDHRHIVTVHEAGDVGGTRFIAMQYVPGRSLSEVIKEEGPQPLERVAKWLEQVASALDYAHGEGVLHRDIKPSNILLDREGRAMLTDFGLAKALEHSGGSVSSKDKEIMTGTAKYMAPEQAKGKPVPQSDIYSLGVVVYELLTGKVPFEGDDPFAIAIRHMTEEPVSPREHRPDLPEPVEAAVLKAMAKQPAARFVTAGEMAGAFRLAVEAEARAAERTRQREGERELEAAWEQEELEQAHGPTLIHLPWLRIALAVVFATVLVAGAVWEVRKRSEPPTPVVIEKVAEETVPVEPTKEVDRAAEATATRTPTEATSVQPMHADTPTATQTPTPAPTATPRPTDTRTPTPKPLTATPTAMPASAPIRRPTATLDNSPLVPVRTPAADESHLAFSVLVAGGGGTSISEAHSGRIVVQLSTASAMSAELTDDGRVLVVDSAIRELDMAGRELRQMPLPRAMTTHALPADGDTVWVFCADDGTADTEKYVMRIAWDGQVITSASGFHYPFKLSLIGLHNVLVVDGTGALTELSATGDVVRTIGMSTWADAVRVRGDGSILVGRPGGLALLSSDGEELWSHATGGRVSFCRLVALGQRACGLP